MPTDKAERRARALRDARRRRIRSWTIGIAVLALGVAGIAGLGALVADNAAAAPGFIAQTTAGERLASRDLQGEVYVLDFFFLTCGICKEQLPHNKLMADTFANRTDFTLVSVTADPADTVPLIEAHRAETGAWWPHVRDTFDLYRKFEVRGNPNLVFVDREGDVAAVVTRITNGRDLVGIAASLLEGGEAPAAPTGADAPAHEGGHGA